MNTSKIVQAIKEKGLTLNGFASKNGIGYATLHDIIHGKTQNPRVETVAKISTAAGVPINELFEEEAGNEESDTKNKEKK